MTNENIIISRQTISGAFGDVELIHFRQHTQPDVFEESEERTIPAQWGAFLIDPENPDSPRGIGEGQFAEDALRDLYLRYAEGRAREDRESIK